MANNLEINESVKAKSVFITTNYALDTGTGNVSHHEIKALAAVTELEKVVTEADMWAKLSMLPNSPRAFLSDYWVANELKDYKVDLAFFNGSPFGITMRVLKPAKTIVDIPAHNIELSVEEFESRNGIGSYPFEHMVEPFLWNMYSQHIQNADVVLCPSKLSAEYISKKLPLKNSMAVVPHGCFLPKEIPDSPAGFSVVHVGVNSTDRGQFYLVKAWSKLKQNPKFSGNLIMVGRGTSLWLPFGVFSSEHVDNIGKVYSDCSVYVQPSVTEGFGIPVLEAMAYARPVIVSEGAGSCELVDDGKNGFIVPIRDSDAIKDKIQYFYDTPSEIKRMGRNARETAEKNSWKIIEDRYQKVIRDVLNERS